LHSGWVSLQVRQTDYSATWQSIGQTSSRTDRERGALFDGRRPR
jgi:hypothetical protein